METAASKKTIDIRITNQEAQIISHCTGKKIVPWEELAQYAKEPTTVKLKTLQKAVSDLKKKYRDANLSLPFDCSFVSLLNQATEDTKGIAKIPAPPVAVKLEIKSEPEQKLVPVRRTRGGNIVNADDKTPDAHLDFKLEPYYKRVKTRTATINLSDNEWELFKLFHTNVGKMLSMEDIKNVVYKDFGSKTPHNWASAIKGTLTKLRTNIRELKTDNRLICVVGHGSTFYMLS